MNAQKVYVLQHSYECGTNFKHDETKFIGVYSSKELAEQIIARLHEQEGFRNYPINCFFVDEYNVDEDVSWSEGFVNTADIARDFEYLTESFNAWLDIKKTPEESWEDDNYYNALCEINPKVYNAKDVNELAAHISLVWSVRFKENPKSMEDCINIATKIFKL